MKIETAYLHKPFSLEQLDVKKALTWKTLVPRSRVPLIQKQSRHILQYLTHTRLYCWTGIFLMEFENLKSYFFKEAVGLFRTLLFRYDAITKKSFTPKPTMSKGTICSVMGEVLIEDNDTMPIIPKVVATLRRTHKYPRIANNGPVQNMCKHCQGNKRLMEKHFWTPEGICC